MTREEVAEIVHGMPSGMDADDYLVELVSRAILREREACAVLCENMERNGAWITKEEAAAAIRANRSQATTSAGKPNYCTPQVTPEVTPEVTGEANETAKVKYMDMSRFPAEIPNWKPGMVVPNPKREWVGIEPQEIGQIWAKHKEVYGFGIELEQVLKKRNT